LRFRGKYAKFQNEDEAIDPDETGGPMAADAGVSIQSSMNSSMGAVSFGQQMSADGISSYNSLGEDINQFTL
jgi:hypothetical protein